MRARRRTRVVPDGGVAVDVVDGGGVRAQQAAQRGEPQAQRVVQRRGVRRRRGAGGPALRAPAPLPRGRRAPAHGPGRRHAQVAVGRLAQALVAAVVRVAGRRAQPARRQRGRQQPHGAGARQQPGARARAQRRAHDARVLRAHQQHAPARRARALRPLRVPNAPLASPFIAFFDDAASDPSPFVDVVSDYVSTRRLAFSTGREDETCRLDDSYKNTLDFFIKSQETVEVIRKKEILEIRLSPFFHDDMIRIAHSRVAVAGNELCCLF